MLPFANKGGHVNRTCSTVSPTSPSTSNTARTEFSVHYSGDSDSATIQDISGNRQNESFPRDRFESREESVLLDGTLMVWKKGESEIQGEKVAGGGSGRSGRSPVGGVENAGNAKTANGSGSSNSVNGMGEVSLGASMQNVHEGGESDEKWSDAVDGAQCGYTTKYDSTGQKWTVNLEPDIGDSEWDEMIKGILKTGNKIEATKKPFGKEDLNQGVTGKGETGDIAKDGPSVGAKGNLVGRGERIQVGERREIRGGVGEGMRVGGGKAKQSDRGEESRAGGEGKEEYTGGRENKSDIDVDVNGGGVREGSRRDGGVVPSSSRIHGKKPSRGEGGRCQAQIGRAWNEDDRQERRNSGSGNTVRRRNDPSQPSAAIAGDRGPVVIDMRAYLRVNSRPSEYLKFYHGWMYLLGVTSYQPLKKKEVLNWFWTFLSILQKVLCASVLSTSAFQSIGAAKYSYLHFLEESGESRYNAFVWMSLNAAWFCTKLFACYLFVWAQEKVEKMLTTMREYEETCYDESVWFASKWRRLLCGLLAVSTLLLAGIRTLFETNDGSWGYLILMSSQEMSENLFIWSSDNMDQAAEKLEPVYSTNLNWLTGMMGGLVLFRDGASHLQLGMLFDLVIIVGIVLFFYKISFLKEVREVTPNVPRANVMEWTRLQARREATWKKYRMFRVVFDYANVVFDPLMKFMHVANLLMYCFFMVLLIFKDTYWLALVLYIINLLKAELSYYIAGRIAEVNEAVRDWIRNWAANTGKITVDGEDLDASLILDELDKKPVGLGKGKFLIHQNFHYKFLGLVLSVFFSMADGVNKAAQDKANSA